MDAPVKVPSAIANRETNLCLGVDPFWSPLAMVTTQDIVLGNYFRDRIVLGINKAIWSAELELSFSEMHIALAPYYICFVLSGILLFISILMLVFPMAKKLLPFCLKKAPVIDKS